MPETWSETFVPRTFDVDPRGKLQLSSLVRAMQNAADGHARSHNLALDQLLPTGVTWVLGEFHCEIHRYAHFLEALRVTTWASGRTAGVRAWRDYIIETEEGELLAAGTSRWMMLDTGSWRPRRLTSAVLAMVNPHRTCAIEIAPGHPGGCEPAPNGAIAVHWLDLDGNGHVNNVRYLDWMLSCVPDAQWHREEPSSLAIEYLGETKPGQTIRVGHSAQQMGRQDFEIRNEEGMLLCRAQLGWRLLESGV